jgi:hypothetical protein
LRPGDAEDDARWRFEAEPVREWLGNGARVIVRGKLGGKRGARNRQGMVMNHPLERRQSLPVEPYLRRPAELLSLARIGFATEGPHAWLLLRSFGKPAIDARDLLHEPLPDRVFQIEDVVE